MTAAPAPRPCLPPIGNASARGEGDGYWERVCRSLRRCILEARLAATRRSLVSCIMETGLKETGTTFIGNTPFSTELIRNRSGQTDTRTHEFNHNWQSLGQDSRSLRHLEGSCVSAPQRLCLGGGPRLPITSHGRRPHPRAVLV